MQSDQNGTHLADLVELRAVVDIFREWSADPIGATVVRSIKDPATYDHNLLVLAAARLLKSWGNSVELIREGRSPVCDLRALTAPVPVDAEVKVPRELRDPGQLPPRTADEIAEAVLKGSREQRHSAEATLLVVGGYRVSASELSVLADALGRQLSGRQTRNAVAGAVVMTIGRHSDDLATTVPGPPMQGGVFTRFAARLNPEIFQLGVAARIGRNATYAGPVPLRAFGASGDGICLP